MSRPTEPTAVMPPAVKALGPGPWLRQNLFNTWYNTLLTLVAVAVLYVIAPILVMWVLSANWEVIPANLKLFLTGTYPRDELWRIWTAVATMAALGGLSAGVWGGSNFRLAVSAVAVALFSALLPFSATARLWLVACALLIVIAFFASRGRTTWRTWLFGAWVVSLVWVALLLYGLPQSTLLPRVVTPLWGGLTLTLVLAFVGIVASFPLGVLLALGRRSHLPAIRWVCSGYIELIRGVPLISILFMAQVLVPIFLPEYRVDKVIRAMIGLTLFTAAYMAENVRGGLQGVPRGQYEAAQAIGMSGAATMLFIVLPQALRTVIPSIVGQFISLFKDTSLVAIIGLLELLGIARSIIANPDWLGLQPEVYMFAAVVYFIFSYSMSNTSRRLERALGVGER